MFENEVYKQREKINEILISNLGRSGIVEEEMQNKQPFEKLSVIVNESSVDFDHIKNEKIGENIVFKGENAYKFLVLLNTLDKQNYKGRFSDGNEDKRVEFAISYGKGYGWDFVINLGRLEMHNKTLITDALMLEADELKIEEEKYLAQHPEIKEINDRKADTYLYYWQGQIADFPRSPLYTRNEIVDSMFTFRSANAKEDMKILKDKLEHSVQMESEQQGVVMECRTPLPVKFVKKHNLNLILTKEEQQKLQAIEDLEITVTRKNPVYMTKEYEKTESYKGLEALNFLGMEKLRDMSRREFVNRMIDINKEVNLDCLELDMIRSERNTMSFSYRGEEYFGIRYELGDLELTQFLPSPLPVHTEKEAYRKIQDAGIVWKKYFVLDTDSKWNRLYMDPCIDVPHMKKILDNFRREKKCGRYASIKDKLKRYETLAFFDFNNDSRERVNKAMVLEMINDGLSEVKIMKVIKENPRWNMEAETKKFLQLPAIKKKIKNVLKSAGMER